MSKLSSLVVVPLLALAAPVGVARATVLGPDAAACTAGSGQSAVLVRVTGFKERTGDLRVQVYGDDPDDFLAKGQKLRRIDLPVTPAGPMDVCVALPKAGNYAVAVRHDVDGNGKSSRNDGGGFSRNPDLSLFSLKPKYKDVVISVGHAPRSISIVLNYVQGLSIKPIKTASR
jgi:uncharacterized protein (DUF2141 family)